MTQFTHSQRHEAVYRILRYLMATPGKVYSLRRLVNEMSLSLRMQTGQDPSQTEDRPLDMVQMSGEIL